jgi:general secretion pathway protein G
LQRSNVEEWQMHGSKVVNQDSAHRYRERAIPPRRLVSSLGFTLLEMMVVIVVIMILASVAAVSYRQHIVQAREAVLRENVQTLNKLIQEYTLDKHQAPQSLDDLITAGYIHQIPVDPMTKQPNWEPEMEDPTNAADPQEPGIVRVHSASSGTASDGTAYSTWE